MWGAHAIFWYGARVAINAACEPHASLAACFRTHGQRKTSHAYALPQVKFLLDKHWLMLCEQIIRQELLHR
jgi:hypothetical protein